MIPLTVREARSEDLQGLLELYTHLHEKSIPPITGQVENVWKKILTNPDHHVIVAEIDGRIAASCTLVIVWNLTHNVRPFGLIEYVVTHKDYRKRGCGAAVLRYARELCLKNDCYKRMLITGSSQESTLRFYERAGFSSAGETAFVEWM